MGKVTTELPLSEWKGQRVLLNRSLRIEQVTRSTVGFRIFIGVKPRRENLSEEDWVERHPVVIMSHLDFYHFCKGLKLEGEGSYPIIGRDLVKFILDGDGNDYEFESEY